MRTSAALLVFTLGCSSQAKTDSAAVAVVDVSATSHPSASASATTVSEAKAAEIARQLETLELQSLQLDSGATTTERTLKDGLPRSDLSDHSGAGLPAGGQIGTGGGAGSADGTAGLSTTSKKIEGPRGNVAIGTASVAGGAIANAAAVVAGMSAGFRRCYVRALKDDPKLQGSLKVVAKIGPDGEVMSANDVPGHTMPTTVAACVVGVVASRTFDKPAGGAATLTVPVRFSL